MNTTKVLQQAWRTVWHYRALWIFGIALALTTTSWSAATLYNRDDGRWEGWEHTGITVTRMPGETFFEALQRTMRTEIEMTRREINTVNRELDRFFAEVLHVNVRSNVLAWAAVLLGVILALYLVGKVARYVGETALIRMVDQTEHTGKRCSVWQGLRLGWSRSAWRLFLIDLLIGILPVLLGILLSGLILAPLPLWVNGSEAVIFAFALSTGGIFLLALVAVIVAVVVLSVVNHFARRACALEGLGVVASIRRGGAVVRQHLKDVGLVWLITLGVQWGWRLALVPVVLLLLGAGVLLGGLPALLAGGLASLAWAGDTPVFVAVAVGVFIFLLVLVGPLVFLDGLREVFLSSTWTLTYRELRPAEAAEQVSEQLPKLDVTGLEAAQAA